MQKNKQERTVLCIALGFILSICFFVISACMGIMIGYGTERSLQKALQQSRYIELAKKLLEENTDTILEQNGLLTDDEEFFDESRLYMDFSTYLSEASEGKKSPYEVSGLKKSCESQLKAYFVDQGIELSNEVCNSIGTMAQQITREYERFVYPDFVRNINKWNSGFAGKACVGMIVAALVGTGIIVLIMCMFHYKHRAMRYISAAVFTAVIWDVLTILYIRSGLDISELGIGNSAYRSFLAVYFREGFIQMGIIAGIFAVLGIGCVLIGKRLKHTIR